MNYYNHPYCSNSALSQLRKDLSTADAIEYANAYRLGTLLDAMVTDPHSVDYLQRTVVGTDYKYTDDEIANSRKMRNAFFGDTLAPHLIKHAEFQKEMYVRDVPFAYQGVTFSLDCKCKYDGYCPALAYGFDLKSTVARSQQAFVAACERFGYYRQAYWYMRLAGARQMVLIGVSKANHEVFKVFIKEGDARWLAGQSETLDLAFKYWTLKPEMV